MVSSVIWDHSGNLPSIDIKREGELFLKGIATAGAVTLACSTTNRLVDRFLPQKPYMAPPKPLPIFKALQSANVASPAMHRALLVGGLGIPMIEEYLFRGVISDHIKAKMEDPSSLEAKAVSVGGNSLLFALAHLRPKVEGLASLKRFPGALVAGVLFSLATESTASKGSSTSTSLEPAIMGHMWWNTLTFLTGAFLKKMK